MRLLISIILVLLSVPALGADNRVIILESRPGVTVSFYYMKRNGAKATVVLLPGGNGDIKLEQGAPASNDFLVRSRKNFSENGFNVAVINKPSDEKKLNFSFRISPRHMADLKRITAYLEEDTHLPIWLIGTSRGTISATAAAIAFGNDVLAGMVLTSSITSSEKPGAVPFQRLEAVRIPVLVFHNINDECEICDPDDVPLIIKGLINSPIKKAILVKGGEDPAGSACGASHRHGYIGMEKEVVKIIANWIQKPAS